MRKNHSWKTGGWLIMLGLVLAFTAFVLSGFRVKGLSSRDLKAKVRNYPGSVKEIVIDEDFGDVQIRISDTDDIKLSSSEGKNDTYDIEHKEGESLRILKQKKRGWFHWDLFRFMNKPAMILEIPDGKAVRFKIQTDNGLIKLEELDASEAELQTGLGAIVLHNVRIDEQMTAQSGKGVIELINVNAEGDLLLGTKLGAVKLEKVYADSLKAKSDNGVIRLINVDFSGPVEIDTSLGGLEGKNIRFASRFSGSADNGGIRLEFAGKQSDYSILADTDLGSSNVRDQFGNTDKTIEVKTALGGIELSFTGD